MRQITYAAALAALLGLTAGCAQTSGTSVSDEAADEAIYRADTRGERAQRLIYIVWVASERAWYQAVHGDTAIGAAASCVEAASNRLAQMQERGNHLFFEVETFRMSLACRDYVTSDVQRLVNAILTPGVDTKLLTNLAGQAAITRSAALDARFAHQQVSDGTLDRQEVIQALRERTADNLATLKGLL